MILDGLPPSLHGGLLEEAGHLGIKQLYRRKESTISNAHGRRRKDNVLIGRSTSIGQGTRSCGSAGYGRAKVKDV